MMDEDVDVWVNPGIGCTRRDNFTDTADEYKCWLVTAKRCAALDCYTILGLLAVWLSVGYVWWSRLLHNPGLVAVWLSVGYVWWSRLLHSPGLMAVWLSVGYEPWPAIDTSPKSHNAVVIYPTMYHSQKCAHFCSECCIVGYGTGVLWDLWDWSTGWHYAFVTD